MIRPLFSLLILLAVALGARAELVVRNPLAGFGGTFVPERFNIVSVEVQNTGGKPWEGSISLFGGDYGGGGVPYEQSLFLSPGASRWVQFYPFITGYQRWQISWQDTSGRGDSMRLMRDDDSIKNAGPVTAIFTAPDSPRSDQSRLRPFLENLFPPAVTGTEGLHAAVLDHVPRWDAPRRQAFRDWVYRGGLVHLLKGLDGNYPEFSEELAPLNISGERGFFGAGRIIRHDLTRTTVSEKSLESDPQLLTDGGGNESDPSGTISSLLADITKPNIPWPLIYFLTVVYVVLIGPVFYMQRKRDYRMMLAAFAITVALFAWLFTVVGRRGYGEKQLIHSLAIAESLGGNRHTVTQWNYAFATSSGRYRFQYPGSGNAYHALSRSGTVRASVRNGADAAMEADIPLFSGRSFTHGGVLVGDDTSVEIKKWVTDESAKDRLATFIIKPNANFPSSIHSMELVYQKRVYNMSLHDGEWVADGPMISKELDAWFSGRESHYYGGYYGQSGVSAELTGQARIDTLLHPIRPLLMAQLTGAKALMRQRIAYPMPDKDSAQLFIYAHTPASLAVPAKDFAFGGGYVLYSQTLRKPSQTP
jgi:hypothetical protein